VGVYLLISRDVGNWTLENFYFQGKAMSADINIPNRTQILVKDLIFQEKYNLTHTQTDLMAYLVNVTKWAMEVDGYFIITTKKIISDLPQIGRKTLEKFTKSSKRFRTYPNQR